MPLQRCQHEGLPGWKWGDRGKCYTGGNAKERALKQARAIKASGYTGNVRRRKRVRTQVVPSNPLKADPTRTTTLRRVFQTEISKRFARLRRKIIELVVEEDAFGLKRKLSIFNEERDDVAGANGNNQAVENSQQEPRGVDRAVDKTQQNLGTSGILYGFPNEVSNKVGPAGTIVANQRWAFHSSPQKVAAFRQWLETQVQIDVMGSAASGLDEAYWKRYVEEGYRKGAGRAFDDTRKVALQDQGAVSDFYQGTKDEFLRSAFAQPVAVEKVQLLAGRVYTDLKGVTEDMSARMTRVLADGLAMGQNPTKIARTLIAEGMGFTKRRGVQSRALTIARTEIIRAHAEGQLDAFENLGVTKLGVMAEWSTAGDDRVCPLCSALEGVVLSVKEARGILPRHPSCRCAYIPANVGEKVTGQKRSKAEVRKAMDDSIRAEMPKIKKRTLAEQKARTSWAGADKTIAKKRPKSILESPTPVRPKPRAVPKPRLKPTPKLPAPKPEAQLPWYDPGRPLPKSYGQLREEYDRLGTAIDAKYADLSNPMDVPKVMLMQKRRNAIGNAYREIYNKELAKIKALPEAERMNAHLRGIQTQWERDKFVARYKREEAALEAKRKKVLASAKRSEKRVEALQRKSDKMGDEWEELYKKNLVLEEQIAAVETQPELVGLPQAQEAVRASLREEVEKNFQRQVFLSGEIDKTVTARTTAIRNRGRNALKAIQPEDPVPVKYAKEGINKEVRQQLNEADKYLKTMTSREAVQSDSLQVTARHLGKEVEQRACCAGDTIYLAQEEGMATIVHETGHALEHGNAKIGAMARGFRLQRVGKEAPIKFIDKWPDSGYRPSEWGCEGGFSSAWEKLWIGKDQIEKSARYTGKVYEHGSTEIVSMGMELLTRDPVAFAQGDPAFFNFMTGVLDGSLLR